MQIDDSVTVPVVEEVTEVVQVLPEDAVSEPAEAVKSVVESDPVFKAVYFDFDGVEIREDAREGLEVWRGKIEALGGVGIVLEGHADSRGSERYNFGLGQRRAVAVKRYLEGVGVGNKLRCVSYGESRSVKENCTVEECHQENRRVELRLER